MSRRKEKVMIPDAGKEYFLVEKILDRKVNKKDGKSYYFIKWLNYGSKWNSWEPEENIIKLHVDEFNSSGNDISSEDVEVEVKVEEKPKPDPGPQLEMIIGATDKNNEVLFLVKWKKSWKLELVPAKVLHEKFPREAIEFYEERLVFHSQGEKDF